MSEVDSTERKITMDEVAEKRPVAKQKGFSCIGTVIFLVIIISIAGAAWYYQSMWLPQAQQKYQQARTMVHDFISPEKVDPMAAPKPSLMHRDVSSNAPREYVVSAIVDPVVKEQPVVVEEAVVEVMPSETVAEKREDVKTNTVENITTETEAPDIIVETNKTSEAVVELDKVSEAIVEVDKAPEVIVEADKASEAIVEVDKETETKSVAQATFAEGAVVTTPKAVVKATEATKTQVAIGGASMAPKKPADLAAARKAFWQQDLAQAEIFYKQQIKTAKADADSWGELGNVYYLQAKWKQAAVAYTEAALLLLDKGDFPQAMYLRYIVFGLAPAQVKRIDEHVKALQAPVNS